MRVENRVARRARCPRCGAGCDWSRNPHRPFCSLACRLVDLGVWLDERYRIPGHPIPESGNPDDRVPPGGG